MATPLDHRQDSVGDDRVRLSSPTLTRRRLLTGTGQMALLALVPMGCAPIVNAPWSDGTFWADGQGWID